MKFSFLCVIIIHMSKNPVSRFFEEVYQETLKVTWPTRQEVIKWLIVVVVISLITAFYVGVLDYIFTQILAYVVVK